MGITKPPQLRTSLGPATSHASHDPSIEPARTHTGSEPVSTRLRSLHVHTPHTPPAQSTATPPIFSSSSTRKKANDSKQLFTSSSTSQSSPPHVHMVGTRGTNDVSTTPVKPSSSTYRTPAAPQPTPKSRQPRPGCRRRSTPWREPLRRFGWPPPDTSH